MLTIVMGPTCAGKSTYIKEHFPDTDVVDLMSFQKHIRIITPETVWESYVACANKLKELLAQNKDVILEHTLLKAARREWYIKQIREVYSGDIDIICLLPSKKLLYQRSKLKDVDPIWSIPSLDIIEIPTAKEGYKNITIIKES